MAAKNFWWKEPSSKLTLKTKCYQSCGCCDNSRSCKQLKKRAGDKYFEKKLDFEPKSPSLTRKVCYHYNSWVTGVCRTCLFHINSGGKISQTKWLFESNLRSFGHYRTWVSPEPQLHRGLAYKSWLGASAQHYHLTLKIGHFERTEVAFKSCIRPW